MMAGDTRLRNHARDPRHRRSHCSTCHWVGLYCCAAASGKRHAVQQQAYRLDRARERPGVPSSIRVRGHGVATQAGHPSLCVVGRSTPVGRGRGRSPGCSGGVDRPFTTDRWARPTASVNRPGRGGRGRLTSALCAREGPGGASWDRHGYKQTSAGRAHVAVDEPQRGRAGGMPRFARSSCQRPVRCAAGWRHLAFRSPGARDNALMLLSRMGGRAV